MTRGTDEGIRGRLRSLPRVPPPDFSRVGPISIVLLVVLMLVASSLCLYTVAPEERGIVLRFGRYRGADYDAGPGLHFKLPFADTVIKLPVERQLKDEFGFHTEEAAIRSRFSAVPDESNMLTGDLNAAVVEWVVQYRIVDPYRFLFRVRNVSGTFRDMSEAVMRAVVGDRTVNEVLTVGREEIESSAKTELQKLCDQYETGIRVEQVVLQSGNPPDPVKPSFNEVNQAEQDRERLINEAQREYNQVVPRAEGEARQAVQQAEGYALDRVNHAKGDASRFTAVYQQYHQAPQVTRRRLYLETLDRGLPAVGRKIIVDGDLKGIVPLLGLDAKLPSRERDTKSGGTKSEGGGAKP
jgi:membrane protease subunit HflK